MTTPVMLIAALVVAIAIILFCIIVLKLNAAIGLAIASLFMGVAGGLDLLTTVDTVSSGFGNMMTSIGLPVGFGTILAAQPTSSLTNWYPLSLKSVPSGVLALQASCSPFRYSLT